MVTLTVDINEEKDLPVIKEILTRFGLNYKIVKSPLSANTAEEKLSKRLKKSFTEINDWKAGKGKLQNAKEALSEIDAELNNGI